MEQLVRKTKRYRLSILAVMETHLPGEWEMVLEEVSGCTVTFSGRQDKCNAEGVGLVLTPNARDKSRILAAEFIAQVGPLLILWCTVCSYWPGLCKRERPVLLKPWLCDEQRQWTGNGDGRLQCVSKCDGEGNGWAVWAKATYQWQWWEVCIFCQYKWIMHC